MRERWGTTATVVLLAAMSDWRPTTNSIVERTGLSRSVVHKWLHCLRDEGLVAFEDGRAGTIRPLVERVG